MTAGLIGYGRFGRLAAELLSRRVRVVVADRRKPKVSRRNMNVVSGSLAEAASQDLVILAVPVSALRAILKDIRSSLRPGALVVDVCAVKAKPAQWMKSALPAHVNILGTHPLFGPDSCSGSLRGLTVVFCPVRIGKGMLAKARGALEREHANVRIMAPQDHDRMIAETIFLTQYVGRLVDRAGLGTWDGATVHYDRLRSIVDAAVHDSAELFADMQKYNRHGARVTRALNKAHTSILRRLENDN